MEIFSASQAYPLRLAVEGKAEGVFSLWLDDDAGHSGGGELVLALDRPLGAGFPTWSHFLQGFVEMPPSQDALVLFGRALFEEILKADRIRDAWQGIAGRAGGRALAMTLELGPHSEDFAALPFELLHDGTGFVFARPGSALRRAYSELEKKEFKIPPEPRVLFVSACPPFSGTPFDPEPHAEALRRVFGKSRVEHLDGPTREGIRQRLRTAEQERDPFHYLHLLAHGYRDIGTAGVCLCDEAGDLDYVDAQRLAQVLAGRGLQLVFLCSCKTAVGSRVASFSGVGQQLLAPSGGDLPCVVASQANLPVARSAELGELFYKELARCGDPGEALVSARRQAYEVGGFGWSVPILLLRPERPAAFLPAVVAGVPTRRATYLRRPEIEDKILDALAKSRLVSVVGLPGIGKTEVGAEAARRAVTAGRFDRAIYREARAGMGAEEMRRILGAAVGLTEPPQDDEELALAFASKPDLLLVIDNAEDLMRTDERQMAFRDHLDTLLAGAPDLRILLTTRWLVGATREAEHEVDVEPLPKHEMASLLEKELRAQGRYLESWPKEPAWEELLRLLDGHPRTLWLVSRQLAGRSASLERVVQRLHELHEDAVVDADLVGRQDVYQTLAKDKKARLRSLVAGMDLSFEVLEKRHPQAIEVFLALSLFPAGLPESVARAVAGERDHLEMLFLYHLAQWQKSRAFYPVPLHWYAERRRSERPIDAELFLRRALEGFVPFVRTCDAHLTSGAILTGLDLFLPELATLESLVERSQRFLSKEPLPLAALATAAGNVLPYAHLYEFARRLFQAGHSSAVEGRDHLGEANCLKSLGDLQMRESELSEARASYAAALPIYREIRDRLGEANCLKSLGLLHLAEDGAGAAFAAFLEVLAAYEEIQDRMGIQACLGYLARSALKGGRSDQALLLAEVSLEVGRRIGDRFGQTITLELQIGIWLEAQDIGPALGAILSHQRLAISMRDLREIERYQPLLDQILPQLEPEQREALESNPEAYRLHGIQEAQARFELSGLELFSPLE